MTEFLNSQNTNLRYEQEGKSSLCLKETVLVLDRMKLINILLFSSTMAKECTNRSCQPRVIYSIHCTGLPHGDCVFKGRTWSFGLSSLSVNMDFSTCPEQRAQKWPSASCGKKRAWLEFKAIDKHSSTHTHICMYILIKCRGTVPELIIFAFIIFNFHFVHGQTSPPTSICRIW